MVAGVSYEKAKVAVRSRPNRAGNSTYYADLKWALDKFGVGHAMNGRRGHRFDGWSKIEGRASPLPVGRVPRARESLLGGTVDDPGRGE